MNEQERKEILIKAKDFFRENIVINHLKNTKKLNKLSNLSPNPFLTKYLANYLTGNSSPESIAKALIYPRVLGTSITTSFGSQMQSFCSTVLDGFASTTSGIDIEFIDQVDGRRKYCQVKSGPNTINRDDVTTIINHFTDIKNLARTNRLELYLTDLIMGVFYGTPEELSGHYKNVDKEFPVYIGEEFWYRLTGDPDFYFHLISSISEIALEVNSTELLESVIAELSEEIKTHKEIRGTTK